MKKISVLIIVLIIVMLIVGCAKAPTLNEKAIVDSVCEEMEITSYKTYKVADMSSKNDYTYVVRIDDRMFIVGVTASGKYDVIQEVYNDRTRDV